MPFEKTFKVKSYNKSEKNRIQVINKEFKNCEKISYSFKGKQRTFYKNSSQLQNENTSDEEQQDEGEKISFHLKLGKHKKFKFM